ncbi:MAG TPA: penicillin-binding protein 2 [Patescibacteria group bacterium]|nr:penicillin-binding protein 2 [Patescibacteria group bacterium]
MLRLRFASLLALIGFAALIGRLFYLQVVQGDSYRIEAESQRSQSYTIPAERGRIFASGGLLATNEEAYRVTANPKLIADPKKTAEKIVAILFEDSRFLSYNPVSQDSKDPRADQVARVAGLLSLSERGGVDLARKVPAVQVVKLKSLVVPGLSFFPDNRRFYPEGAMAASLLGFVAFNEDGEKGYNGLEGNYDGDLKGKPGSMRQEYNEQKTEPILVGESTEVEPQNGADLYLTINRGVQAIMERKIAEGVKRYGAKSGSFVVLEPKSGYVLAMGNYPSFDPGNFNAWVAPQNRKSVKKETRNLGLATNYEPGSIMKPITISAGLESKKIKPSWTFNDNGRLKIGSYYIDTWDGRHFGKDQTLAKLLQKSNNVGAARLALKIGRETLRSYFLNFGFGSKTEIDLAGEEIGLIKGLRDWRQIDLANAGFGQGIGVTAIQMTSAYAAIANGGILMKPKVVERLVDRNGRQVSFPAEPIRRVISPKTSEIVANLIRSAVEGGESMSLRNLRYRVAGKTGTAEIPVGGKYSLNKTNVTFVGFPFKDRSFVMLVRLEEPSTSTYSALTVVPLWVEMFKEIVPLFGISPDR